MTWDELSNANSDRETGLTRHGIRAALLDIVSKNPGKSPDCKQYSSNHIAALYEVAHLVIVSRPVKEGFGKVVD